MMKDDILQKQDLLPLSLPHLSLVFLWHRSVLFRKVLLRKDPLRKVPLRKGPKKPQKKSSLENLSHKSPHQKVHPQKIPPQKSPPQKITPQKLPEIAIASTEFASLFSHKYFPSLLSDFCVKYLKLKICALASVSAASE